MCYFKDLIIEKHKSQKEFVESFSLWMVDSEKYRNETVPTERDISKWVNGKVEMRKNKKQMFADYFGISLDDFEICDDMGDVGDKIKYYRKRLNVSQAQLAQALGYKDGNTVLHWERGRSPVPNNKLDEIAKILRCDVKDLLGIPTHEKTLADYSTQELLAEIERRCK